MYYKAFMELSTCRAIGMMSGPIPWTAVNTYAVREGFTGDDYEQFVLLVRMMDVVYLEYQVNEAKKK